MKRFQQTSFTHNSQTLNTNQRKVCFNMHRVATLLALLESISVSNGFRFGMVNDVHLNLTYSGDCSFPYCYSDGEYGLDSDLNLVKEILNDMHEQYDSNSKSIDAIILSGDFVMHGVASRDPAVSNWDIMKQTISEVTTQTQTKFPEALILPCIGNNDVINHYQAPDLTQKDQFYSDLYQIWFENTINSGYPNLATIESTFKTGGYYRFDLSSHLSFIALNTIYFSIRNNADLATGDLQITWLKELLD